METCSNWGAYPKVQATVITTDAYNTLQAHVKSTNNLIARGNGRCYGDSSLQKNIISTLAFKTIFALDQDKSLLHCQAGVLLDDILKLIVPQGFFLPVTPGTKRITIGGAVASNIHGKNHHKEGAIGQYVEEITLMAASGAIEVCSRATKPALFFETIGGMGLTGVILEVKLKLKPIETSYTRQKSICLSNLAELLQAFDKYQDANYSVAWLDAMAKGSDLGKSVLLLGEHAGKNDLHAKFKNGILDFHQNHSASLPKPFPAFLLNKLTAKIFNYYHYQKARLSKKAQIVHYDAFFYPLDAITNWNAVYGKKGFLQYQFVIPTEQALEGLTSLLQKVSASKIGVYLAVIKRLSKEKESYSPLSFPMDGYTVALDFKVSKSVFALLDELDQLVLQYKGRVYLTKDARMKKESFAQFYPNAPKTGDKFNSLQSQRLGL